MIKTTNAYKEAIKNNRILHHRAEIRFTDGTTITAEDAGLFTFRIDENTSNANSFDVGAAVAKQLTLKLDNLDDKYSAHDFSGAEITAYVGLDVSDKTEWLNKGTYYAEPGEDSGDTITVSAYDKMTEFDQPYTISNLIYPATLGQIVRDACSCCNVSLCADSASFDNDSFIVETRPEDSNTTFRQVLRWVGEIACKFSRINSNNQLTLQWYDTALLESSSIDSDPEVVHIDNPGSGSTFSTDDVVITGIRVIEETKETANVETIYQYGADGYVLEISGNKLIQGGKGQEVAQLVGSKLNGLQFRPLSVNCQSDPSIEVGDIGLVTDRKGRTYKTIITGAPYTARALQTLSCGAEAPARLSATRYSEATKVYKELRKNLVRQKTEWEKTMKNLEKAMKEQIGLYPVVKTLDDGSKVYYMCDHQTLEESSVVFELNAKGWAVSTDGGKTWNAGLMVDGAMITKILNSIGINADWINSGAITIMDAKGNTTFKADTVTGRVDIIADSFQLRGKTVEEIAKETAGKYVDATIGDIIKDVTSQYFGKYDPTLSNIPASEWTDIETKEKHLNDIFYNTDTKKMFRFIKTADTYRWENFTDPDIQTALDNASKAQDTADGKRRVFMTTPVPPYDAGDMWATSTADGKADIKICKAAKAAGSVFSSADWIDPAYVNENDVQSAIEEYDNSLGQPEIFNKLTNNGKNKGIYIENGGLYINASYILSGILAGKLINAKGVEVTDKDNEITLKIDDDGHVFVKATEFTLRGKNIEEIITEKSDKFRTLNVSLSNVFQAIPTDMDGKYTSFPSCSTTVTVLYGDEDVTNTSIISFKTTSGISGSASKNVYTVTGLSADTGIVTVTVERGSLAVEKQFTVVKQKQGIQGLQGLQGKDGTNGINGTNGADGKTTYFHIKYSTVSNPTSSSQMTETPSEYIGTYVDFTPADSTDPKKYTWSRFAGRDGSQGIPGTNGTDGKTSYLHIAYATSPDGSSGFSVSDSTGKTYIGQYTDFTAADSTNPSKYSWSKIKGEDGTNGTNGKDGISPTVSISKSGTTTTITITDKNGTHTQTVKDGTNGTPGTPGANGKTPYLHVKYSNDGGKTFTSNSGETVGSYIGTCTDYNAADPTTVGSYTWAKIKGETGATGATGNGISSITTYYMVISVSSGVSTSTSGWTTSIQTPTATKPYLWSYQTTYYTDGTSSSTVPHIIGIRGMDGKDPGELTQQQIFNILTNNGQTQGIYLSGGKIYINGEYIKADSITADTLDIEDLYSIGAKIGGFTIASDALSVTTNSSYTFSISSAEKKINIADGSLIKISHNNVNRQKLVLGGPTTKALLGNVDCAALTSDAITATSVRANSMSSFTGGLTASSLNVTGTKKRVFNTDNYGMQAFYCYEMASPVFGDIGEATIANDGYCIIDIDDIFQESANMNIQYYVFLQKENEGDCWITERAQNYFVVKGTPGLKFAFEIKARQADYEHMRFADESESAYDRTVETLEYDYEAEFTEIFEPNYESELENDRITVIKKMEGIE